METERGQLTTVEKEMGITHKAFYGELPNLLAGIPYAQGDDSVTFQLNGKHVEIKLGPEGFREVGLSLRLPVTFVTLRFYDFNEVEVDDFIRHFNLKFMRGGG